ncbi:uroplakin-3b [Cetorhinus maximus]
MKPLVQFVLLCALCGAGNGVPERVTYVPEIVRRVVGKITQTTVALQQPLCVFETTEQLCTACDVWLVVANSTGVSKFENDKNGFLDPSMFTYEDAFSGSNGFYFTLRTKRSNYACPPATGQILSVRVGSEVPCTTSNCNAPLPAGGTFRMKYVLVNPDLAFPTANIIGETEFSEDIKLLSAKDPNSIDNFSVRRTGGMVVITAILSILLFLLLAMFAAMLALVCCKKSVLSDFPEPLATSGSLRKYHTHSLQTKSNIIPPKGKM